MTTSMFPGAPRPRTRSLFFFILVLCAWTGPACGGSKSKSGTPSNPPAGLTAYVTSPVGPQNGIVAVHYSLSDVSGTAVTITVEYSVNGGGTFQPASVGPGGEGTAGLSCSAKPGTSHTFLWNSQVDGVGLAAASPAVQIRITPRNTIPGTPGVTASFTVDNSTHTPPSAALTTPGSSSALVSLSYTLTDAESDPCSIAVEFSTDAGATFAPATAGPGGDGMTFLASSPGGSAHVFLWNSVTDGVGLAGAATQVRLRLQPNDGKTGAKASTANFSVDNTGASGGTSVGGAYPVQVNSTGTSDWATATATDGVSLYTAGFEGFDFTAVSGADSTWRLEKRTLATGALVPLFGSAGAVSENPGPGLDVPFKVLIDGSYLFVVGAQESALGSRSFTLRVEKRRTSDGSLVAAFGTAGILTGPAVGTADGIPFPWALAADGSFLYLAGTAPETTTDLKWRIEKRDKLTGALIPGFGSGGGVEDNPTGAVDGCFGIVIDASSMWLVGADSVDAAAASDGQIRIEKRSLADGSPAAGFGTAGVITINAGPGDDLAEDVVSDGTSLYIYSRVETAASSGLFNRRLEKRSLVDGSLVQGPVTSAGTDPSGALPFRHLFLDGSSLMVCAGDGSGICAWIVEKRQTSDLSLVTAFGTAGVLTINPVPGGYHRPLDLVVSGGVVVVGGMSSSSGDDRWRLEARWR
jgi:hypothetical protein